jgi:outer membrane protein OmpA-like peptidoglycan-associated protein
MLFAAALDAGSCASPGKRTAIGAGGGAAGGAVIGGLAGGWKGAAIGAGVGALAGGAVGNYLDKQANELEQVAETKRTENGVLVNLKNDVLFDTGKAEVKPQAMAQLNQVGDILAKYPDDRIRIAGFTDSTGGKTINELLSQQRAQSVANVLSQRGVKPQQMQVAGRGPESPVASNKTTAGRAKNRRVELHIDVPGAQQAGQQGQAPDGAHSAK